MTNSSPDGAALERMLAHRHHDFVQGLAERFDLSAGLREVQLADRHTGLVDGLGAGFDIEAGLAAIVPISAPDPETALDDLDEGSPEWASRELNITPLPIRLSLRAAYADKLGAAAHEALRLSTTAQEDQAGLVVDGNTRISLLRQQFEMLVPVAQVETDSPARFYEVDYRRGRQRRPTWLAGYPNQLQFDLNLRENREKDNQFETHLHPDTDSANEDDTELRVDIVVTDSNGTAVAWSPAFGKTPPLDIDRVDIDPARLSNWVASNNHDDVARSAARWIVAVHDFVLRTLNDLEKQADKTTESLMTVAGYLHQYEQLLNDFTGADLREVDLSGVPLEGLRWSAATTHWPDTWREQIERDSIPVDDDVYEIHYGTKTHQGTLV